MLIEKTSPNDQPDVFKTSADVIRTARNSLQDHITRAAFVS